MGELKEGNNVPAWKFGGIIAGVFVFWTMHDAVQEALFRMQGYHFGFFMALCLQVGCVLGSLVVMAVEQVSARNTSRRDEIEAHKLLGNQQHPSSNPFPTSEDSSQPSSSALSFITLGLHYLALATTIALSGSLANASLSLVQQPVKV